MRRKSSGFLLDSDEQTTLLQEEVQQLSGDDGVAVIVGVVGLSSVVSVFSEVLLPSMAESPGDSLNGRTGGSGRLLRRFRIQLKAEVFFCH